MVSWFFAVQKMILVVLRLIKEIEIIKGKDSPTPILKSAPNNS